MTKDEFVKEFKGKFWHRLSKKEIDSLPEELIYQDLMDTLRQPTWCTYPGALRGVMGCWSLMDTWGRRKEISHRFCADCDCYKNGERHD